MKKRAASLFLALIMVLSLLPIGALAEEMPSALEQGGSDASETAWARETEASKTGETVTASHAPDTAELMNGPVNQCGENAVWILEDGVLTISGTGSMYHYANNADLSEEPLAPWTAYRDQITSVVIQKGIIGIGDRAFFGCNQMTAVEIADTVETIGRNAFCQCSRLTAVHIPQSVKEVGTAAFYDCTALETINIPPSLKTVPDGAFLRCTSLKEITVPENITAIGYAAFMAYSALTKVTLNANLETIGTQAFARCESLKEIVIPKTVVSIEEEAFAQCGGLTAVTFPAALLSIGDRAFYGCPLSRVLYGGTREQWAAIVMGADNSPLQDAEVQYGAGNTDDQPGPAENACGDSAYWELKDDTLTISGTGDMYDYTSGTSPWSGQTFSTVRIASGILSIGRTAFEFNGVKTVYLPASVIKVADAAFYGDPVEDVYYGGSTAQWNAMQRSEAGNYYFNNAKIHAAGDSVEQPDHAFEQWDGLLHFSVYSGEKNDRVYGSFFNLSTDGTYGFYHPYVRFGEWFTSEARLSFRFAEESKNQEYTVTVYKGKYQSEENAKASNAEDVTARIWNVADITQAYTGLFNVSYHDNSPIQVFTMVSRKAETGEVVDTRSFVVCFALPVYDYSPAMEMMSAGETPRTAAALTNQGVDGETTVFNYTMNSGYPASGVYKISMLVRAVTSGVPTYENGDASDIGRAVVGAFDILTDEGFDALFSAEDIREELFSEDGYPADFGSGDVTITILNTDGTTDLFRFHTQAATTPGTSGLTYNLHHREVPMGDASHPYNEDGSFTIQLEKNPFFPYQVQFRLGTRTEKLWFTNENSTHYIDDHLIKVAFEGKARSVGFQVGGEYIQAAGAGKTFTNDDRDPDPTNAITLGVDFGDRLWNELKNIVPVIPYAENIYFASEYDEGTGRVQIVDAEHPIDLSRADIQQYYHNDELNISGFYITAGSGNMNNPENDRYTLIFSYYDARNMFDFSLRTDKARDLIPTVTRFFSAGTAAEEDLYLLVYPYEQSNIQTGDKYAWIDMRFNTRPLMQGFTRSKDKRGITVSAYEGIYHTSQEIAAAEPTEITSQIWGTETAAASGYRLYLAETIADTPGVTLVFEKDGAPVDVMPVRFGIARNQSVINGGDYLYDAGTARLYAGWLDYDNIVAGDGPVEGSEMLECPYNLYYKNKFKPDGKYCVSLYAMANDIAIGTDATEYIDKAAAGMFTDAAAFDAAEDIQSVLFVDPKEGGGYLADFSKDVCFTVRDSFGIFHYVVMTARDSSDSTKLPPRPTPQTPDSYFQIYTATGSGRQEPSDYYVNDFRTDSYYYNGYQTVFQRGVSFQDGETIYPTFGAGSQLKIAAGSDVSGTSAVEQVSGETGIAYHKNQPIRYSAVGSDGKHVKNLWVTYLTPQTNGAELFVNGVTNIEDAHRDVDESRDGQALPKREVLLDNRYQYRHDILIANIGSAPLTGLTVRLAGNADGTGAAENVALDSAFLLNNATLPPFSHQTGAAWNNIGTIRLVPNYDVTKDPSTHIVRGYLLISADGQDEIVVKLTGVVGKPKIVTESLADGVKYVHYSSVIQTSNLYDFDPPVLEVVRGTFPDWAVLRSNGEIYGVPQDITDSSPWNFTVRATFYGDEDFTEEREYTLSVLSNTNANVWAINDYKDLEVNSTALTGGSSAAVYDLTVNPNALLVLHAKDAAFSEFTGNLTVDGRNLKRVSEDTPDTQLGADEFKASDGSIIATILSQSMRSSTNGTTHTISMENRTNGNPTGKLTRTSVNVTVKKAGGSGGGSGSGGSSGGSSRSSGSGSGNRTTYYSITTASVSHGTLRVSPTSATKGTKVAITATPSSGYRVKAGSVTAADSAVSGSGTSYSFTMPDKNVTVSAVFEPVTYHVVPEKAEHGKFTVSREYAAEKDKVTITAQPDNGYVVTKFSAWDETGRMLEVTNNDNGTAVFEMSASPVRVSGLFELDPGLPVTDIKPLDWFYEDARWAYRRGIMVGVTGTLWAPEDKMSTATAVATLARLADADLTDYQDAAWTAGENRGAYSWIPADWYTAEARWAAANHILTEDLFTGREVLPRASLAVMMKRFLNQQGVVVTVPEDLPAFSDADAVRSYGAETEEAFRILHYADVFRGDSTRAMLPGAATKRTHLAATLHRLSDYIIRYWETKADKDISGNHS